MITRKHLTESIKLAQALPPEQAGPILVRVVLRARKAQRDIIPPWKDVEAEANALLQDLALESSWEDTQQYPDVAGQLVRVKAYTTTSYPKAALTALAATSTRFRKLLATTAKNTDKEEKWVVKKY